MAVHRRQDVIDTLRQRILSASHLGMLKPGERLPSARDIARELGVDRRVALAAYRHLEREGIVQLRRRSGIYFAPVAARQGVAVPLREEWVVDVLAAAVSHGVPAPALADELHRYIGTLRLRVACIECNDDQIDSLCRELRADYGFEAGGVPIDPHEDDSALHLVDDAAQVPVELRRADLLVTTPFHAGEVKLLAERLGKPWIAAELRADVFTELARRLADGPAYAVVADPRFAYKLDLIYRKARKARHFQALVVGRDDLGRIPPDTPTYVSRLARERLAGAPLAVHAIPEPRAFSAASTRELLTFVVRANMAALEGRATG